VSAIDISCCRRIFQWIDTIVGHLMAFSQDLELFFDLIRRLSKGTH
jgi:hypothetical protein